MDPLEPLAAVVLTYREVAQDALGALGRDMHRCAESIGKAAPMFVLHTCGRVEAYFYGAPEEAVADVAARYRRYAQEVKVLRGREAARHLLEVAAGLDSMLIGETDILGQVEEAFDRQVKAGLTRGLLREVVERAVRAGKRVRTETGISRGPRGLGSLSIIYVSSLVDLRSSCAAVLGAGAVGSGLARELAARGVGRLIILNRTPERARELAERLGAEWGPLTPEHLERALKECHVVFSSVHSMDYVIRRIPEGAAVKVVVDLGVPANVAPGLPVRVIKLDDLRGLAERFNAERAGEVERARAIVEEELARLERLLARRAVEEAVAALMERALKAAEEEGARAGCPEAVLAARTAVKRALMPLVESLKRMAEDGQLEDALKLAGLVAR